ncbi:MAG: hypothetical protein O7J95_04975 [Planctomycetota bacterium]|nr:hypothetical protein [Planctomycetota bacterium]
MRQLLRLLLSATLIAVPTTLVAQTGPQPWRKGDIPPTGHFSLSLEYDRIGARDLDDAGVSGVEIDDLGVVVDALDAGTRALDVELASNAFYLRGAYSVYSPAASPFGVEVFLLLGGADVDLEGGVVDPGSPPESFDLEGDFDLTVGGGFRSRLYAVDRLKFLAEFSVRWSGHDTDVAMVDNLELDLDLGESARPDFDLDVLSWQLSIYASYVLDVGRLSLAPYGGFRFSGVSVDLEGRQDFFDPGFDGSQTIDYDTEEDGVFGLFLGVEAAFTENVAAFVEVRFVEEFALTIGAGFRF